MAYIPIAGAGAPATPTATKGYIPIAGIGPAPTSSPASSSSSAPASKPVQITDVFTKKPVLFGKDFRSSGIQMDKIGKGGVNYPAFPSGYSASFRVDPFSGVPLLQRETPNRRSATPLSERVATTFDPTIPQKLTRDMLTNKRMPLEASQAVREKMGAAYDEQLDHIISLQLAGSNKDINLEPVKLDERGMQPLVGIENQLGRMVINGEISLLEAQRTLALQKGVILQDMVDLPSVYEGRRDEVPAAVSAFPATMQVLAELQMDPLSLKANPSKFMEAYLSGMAESATAAADELAELVFSDPKKPGSWGRLLSFFAKTGGAALSPVTSLFTAAEEIPVAGTVAKLIAVPFAVAGDLGHDAADIVGQTLLRKLPEEDRHLLVEGIGEVFALAGQIYLGGKAAEVSGALKSRVEYKNLLDRSSLQSGSKIVRKYGLDDPVKLVELEKKYGAKDTKTIVEKAKEIAAQAMEYEKQSGQVQKGYIPVKDAVRPSVRQPHATIEEMLIAAPEAKVHIDKIATDVAKEVGGRPIIPASLKLTERITEKAKVEYGGDHARVTDVARNTVLTKNQQAYQTAVEKLTGHPDTVRVTTHTPKAHPMGYSGTRVVVKAPNGHLAEIQVNTPEMIYAKETAAVAKNMLGEKLYEKVKARLGDKIEGGKGHQIYEEYRKLDPEKDLAKRMALEAESKQYYDSVRTAYKENAPKKALPADTAVPKPSGMPDHSAESFIKAKGLEADSIMIKDNARSIVENTSGRDAYLTEVPLSAFGKPKFETLNQKKYKPGRKITDPIEATLENGKLKITEGANRFTQALANGDKTIPVAIEVIVDGKALKGPELKAAIDAALGEKKVAPAKRTPEDQAKRLESRVYARMKAEHPDLLKDDATFKAKNIKQEIKKAVELVARDRQKAYRIAVGAEKSPNVLSNAVNIAMREKALADGNVTLYNQLVKLGSFEQTRRGQELVSEKAAIGDNSTSRYVKQLLSDRLDRLGKKYLDDVRLKLRGNTRGQKAMDLIDREVKRAQRKIAATKEIDLADAQRLIDSLICK